MPFNFHVDIRGINHVQPYLDLESALRSTRQRSFPFAIIAAIYHHQSLLLFSIIPDRVSYQSLFRTNVLLVAKENSRSS
jgi:hypothetical protein